MRQQTSTLSRRWLALAESLSPQRALDGWGDVFSELLERYGEPHRAYHTMEHIADCMKTFDAMRDHIASPPFVEAALWFHDVIYDPRAHDNEAQSARWAATRLLTAGVEPVAVSAVSALVEATAHMAPDSGSDAGVTAADRDIIIDIDLAILGSDPLAFERYDAAVREEYRWLDDQSYREGRAKVLREFQRRPTLYRTEEMRARYELAARRNLEAALAQLPPAA